jgi:hypothetical protein
MPIKYAEITIIINTEKESILNYFNRLLGNENQTNDNDTIIILFDDEIICDVKKECKNINTKLLKMGPTNYKTDIPIYFEIKDTNETYFSKSPREDNGNLKLNFNPIFANNKKHITTTKESSVYNSIFERGNSQVLAIVKIKSNELKPRYLLAYDEEYFKKEHIIYFVNYIFKT